MDVRAAETMHTRPHVAIWTPTASYMLYRQKGWLNRVCVAIYVCMHAGKSH
jgi:hypothetical protein